MNQQQKFNLECTEYEGSNSINLVLTIISSSIEILIRKVEIVVSKKYEIEYGDDSKFLAHLFFSDHQNSEAKIKTIVCIPQ